MDGYERAASSLRDLSQAEQDWFLGQLPPADRERVAAALDAPPERALSADAPPNVTQPSAGDTVRTWDAATLVQLLSDEPLWLVVLALSQLDPTFTESVIAQIKSSQRSTAIRQTLYRMAGTVKPRVTEVLFRELVRKAERRRDVLSSTLSDFDATLTRITEHHEVTGKGI